MGKRLLALLLLVPGLAFGQGLSLTAPGVTGGGKVLWQAPFATPGCYASGQTAGASSAISITRATDATVALTSDPSVLTTCASGEFRVGYQGLAIEPSRTNYALRSSMSTGTSAVSPWSLSNATVATVAGAPGGGTWAEITSTTNVGYMTQAMTPASSTAVVGSMWMAKATGSGAAGFLLGCSAGGGAVSSCTCSTSDGSACTAAFTRDANTCDAYLTSLTTTPVRLSVALVCGTANTVKTFFLIPGVLSTSTGTTRFGAPMLEVGTWGPSSFISVAGTAVVRNADAVSATVPAVPSGASGKWAINVAAMSYGDPSTTQANLTQRVWSLGTTGANTASLDVSQAFVVTDAAAGVKTFTTTGAPGRSTQRVTAMDKGGTLSLLATGATTGAGTGVLTTPPTTLYFGSASGTSLHLGGFIKGLRICGPVSKIGDCK